VPSVLFVWLVGLLCVFFLCGFFLHNCSGSHLKQPGSQAQDHNSRDRRAPHSSMEPLLRLLLLLLLACGAAGSFSLGASQAKGSSGCFRVTAKPKLGKVAVGDILQVNVKLVNPNPSIKAPAPLRYVLRLDLPVGITLINGKSTPKVDTQPLAGNGMVVWELDPISAGKKKIVAQFNLAVGACATSPLAIGALSFQLTDGSAICTTRPSIDPVSIYVDAKVAAPICPAAAASLDVGPKFRPYGPPGTMCLEQGTLANMAQQPTSEGCFESCSFTAKRTPLFFNYVQGTQSPECRCVVDTCTLVPVAGNLRRRTKRRKLFQASLQKTNVGPARALTGETFGAFETLILATHSPTSRPTMMPTVSFAFGGGGGGGGRERFRRGPNCIESTLVPGLSSHI
jgi:hypothetical protein